MYNYICPKNKCTGCMACANICSHSAISIITDELGFVYPVINEKCTGCNLCRRVCPQLNKPTFIYPQSCYAATTKDKDELMSSASGGIATELARYVLENGGIVVGCSGQDIYDIQHIIIRDINDLKQLKGSKYVQSKISISLMREIKSELVEGTTVLFIGTGCQVAGLKSYLVKNFDNLITVDLVCHGVPSQKMLNGDLALYGNINTNYVTFRRKISKKGILVYSDDAIKYGLSLTKTGKDDVPKQIFKEWYSDPYLGSFMACVNLREGCYSCQYAQPERQSDITLCDFWGLGKDSKLSKSLGVNAVLINSDAGNSLFNKVSEYLIVENRNIEEAIKGNGQLQKPSECPSYRRKYIDIYLKYGLKKAYKETAYYYMVKKHYLPIIYKYIRPIYSLFKKIIK